MIWQPYINLVEALLKYTDRESRKQAYAAALQAIRIAPEVAGTHTTLGRVYMSIGERDAARRCFERAIGISPTDAAATTNLAILDLHGGRLNRAGQGLRSVAAANPGVAKHAYNVRVAATHWVMRALDFGTLAWLAQLALDLYVRRPLGGILALAVSAVYVTVTGVLYARLPKPMRRLVVEHLMGRHRVVSALFIGLFAYFVWASVAAATQHSPGEGFSARDVAIFAIALAVRFPSRIRSFAEPYVLRRRYRRYVLGDVPIPVIPRQRTNP
jgi:tetratricopeptide (TPR) repeat protein